MSGLVLYIIFATSVALSACYEIMRPAIHQLRSTPDDAIFKHKFLAYLSMFAVSWLTAPFTFFAIFVPGMPEKVVQGITQKGD